jgi:hypothetical protein
LKLFLRCFGRALRLQTSDLERLECFVGRREDRIRTRPPSTLARPAASTAVANASISYWPELLASCIASITLPASTGETSMQNGMAIEPPLAKRLKLDHEPSPKARIDEHEREHPITRSVRL